MNKVWIYPSEKFIDEDKVVEINDKINTFIEGWSSHGRKITGSGYVLKNHFIVIEVDSSIFEASGCSIDKSVQFIKSLEVDYSLVLFDRMKMPYLKNETVNFIPISEIKNAINQGMIKPETLIFNTTISDSSQMQNSFEQTFSSSGYLRFA